MPISTIGANGLNKTEDFTIDGLTVGQGGGSVASNTAVGSGALPANTTGVENAAFGKSALLSNTSANNNTALGCQSLYSNTTGSSNTAAGQNAMISNTTGAENAAFGKSAMNNNSTANNNSAFGCQSLYSNTTGTNNTSVGHNAMITNTTGSQNTAVGESALYLNTTASNNTAVGYQAGYSNTTGDEMTATGYQALYANTTGQYNSAFGLNALRANTTGNYNTAVGNGSLRFNTTSNTNTAVGYQAGFNTTGGNNTYVGTQAGYNITTGAKNTILGRYDGNQGGLDIRTANNYIVLSDGDGNPRMACESGGNFAIGIAPTSSYRFYVYRDDASSAVQFFNNRGNANDFVTSIVLGANTNTSTAYFIYCPQNGVAERFSVRGNGGIYNYQANNSNLSDRREKTDIEPAKSYLDTICAIPVQTFKYVDQTDDEKTLGVIAQDVQAVAPELVSESDWGTEDNPKMRLSIYQTDLQYALMKCIQELNAKVEALEAKLASK